MATSGSSITQSLERSQLGKAPGPFTSPVSDDLYGVGTELGEVLHGFDGVHESKASNNGDGCVTQRRERLDDGRGAHATSILAKRSVPDTVQLVLNAPVEPGEPKQAAGIGSLPGQPCDGVDGLARGLAPNGPLPGDPTHLLHAGPSEVGTEGVGTPQFPIFDPAVSFAVVGRVVDVSVPLPLLPGGKWARRTSRRCRPEASALPVLSRRTISERLSLKLALVTSKRYQEAGKA